MKYEDQEWVRRMRAAIQGAAVETLRDPGASSAAKHDARRSLEVSGVEMPMLEPWQLFALRAVLTPDEDQDLAEAIQDLITPGE